MTKQEYMDSVKQYDGELIDATGLAEYHYKLKTEIIDNLPKAVIITEDNYEITGSTVKIKGFSTFPTNQDYTYKFYIDDTVSTTPVVIDDSNKFQVEYTPTNEISDVYIAVFDKDNNLLSKSKEVKVTAYRSIRTSYCNSNYTIDQVYNCSAGMGSRDTYKGTVQFFKDSAEAEHYTFWLFIPKLLTAPNAIVGLPLSGFEKVNSYSKHNVNYDVFKLTYDVAISETNPQIILQ